MANPQGVQVRKFIVGALMTALAHGALGAEFAFSEDGLSITGEIKRGDYDRFRQAALTKENIYTWNVVYLDSPGGDVIDALKFANLFEQSFVVTKVYPDAKCYSACFLMWAGGVNRILTLRGELGVHRISLREFTADIKKSKNLISPLASDVGKYLVELGIPRALVDRMNETPASSIFKLTDRDILKNGWAVAMETQPVYFDAVEKACGKNPDPSPGDYLGDRLKDEALMGKMRAWGKCQMKIRNGNRLKFFDAELDNAEKGKPTLLITRDKVAQVKDAFLGR